MLVYQRVDEIGMQNGDLDEIGMYKPSMIYNWHSTGKPLSNHLTRLINHQCGYLSALFAGKGPMTVGTIF